MEIAALLIVLFAKTDNNGVYTDYKISFPTMKLCLDAVESSKMSLPASENETSIALVCVPEQKFKHERIDVN